MKKINKDEASYIEKLKVFLVFFLWKTSNWVLENLCKLLYQIPNAPQKIIIFRTGSLGDSICAIPAILSVRKNFPTSQIDILTNAGASNLVSLEKLLARNVYNNIIDYLNLSRRTLVRQLKDENYDLIIQFPQNRASFASLIRDLLFFRLMIGIKSGFGWQVASVNLFRKTQEKFILQENERERLLKILQRQNLAIEKDKYEMNINELNLLTVESALKKISDKVRKPFIALVVGAKRPQNRWPIAYFKEVAEYFCTSYSILIVGGSEDKELASPLLTLPNTYDFCGKLTPIQSGILLSKCEFCITNDTGPMHLAYAFKTKVVAIFSARDYSNKWFPPKDQSHLVFRSSNIACSLCLSETCMNNICMQKITPEMVIRGIKKDIIL